MCRHNQLRTFRSIAEQVGESGKNVWMEAEFGFFNAGNRCWGWVQENGEQCKPAEGAVGESIDGMRRSTPISAKR